MNVWRKSRVINTYVFMLLLTGWILLIAGVSIAAYPAEATRLPNNIGHIAAATQPVATAIAEQEKAQAESLLTGNQDNVLAKWTFMVYIAADNDLEGALIGDFIEMANIGSNDYINIVVQLDRVPGYDDSYDDWTDCRRFLVTEGLTPADGNEIMSIGEVNMGDPDTLVDFVEWTAFNYPAEQYALIIASHGKGWEGCCWDETSDNDNLDLAKMRSAFSEIFELIGQPVDLLGFDACLMGTIEVAYEVRDYASVMVASEHAVPSSGWPYDTILAQLVETPEVDAAQLATIIVDDYYAAYAPTGYTMAAVDLAEIDTVVVSLSDLVQALAVYDGTDTEAVKEYATSVITALDETIIHERHGTSWPGSYGIAIYFPKAQGKFDSAYTAGTVSLVNDTAWNEFLIGYYTYADDDWITAARGETQQYHGLWSVDLYDFCQNLIDSAP